MLGLPATSSIPTLPVLPRPAPLAPDSPTLPPSDQVINVLTQMMDKLNTLSINMEMMSEHQDRSERLIVQIKCKNVDFVDHLP